MKEASYTAIVAMADAAIAANAPLDPEAVAAAGADYEAAISIRRQLHTRWIRRHAPEVREQLPALAAEWRAGADITTLARRCAYPPYLTARMLIEVLCGVPKAKVGDVVKAADTAIADPRLRRELREAMDADPDTGPANDRVRRIVGAEYELLLQRKLRGRRVPYESEDELRVRGLAKTPDVRFLIPLGVRDPRSGAWCEVNWIDSKAMFGDPLTYESEHLPQLMGYVNRYGPGLVIYWFGFVETLPVESDITVLAAFPDELLFPGEERPTAAGLEPPAAGAEAGFA